MDYVTYAPSGLLTGGYSQELAEAHADCYIEVTVDQRINWIDFCANDARDGVEALPPPAAETVSQLIAKRIVESDGLAAAKRNAIVAGTSPAEMASWPIKLAEAVKYVASNDPPDAPYLTAEAAARNITLAALVAKVQTNGAVLAGLEAQIAGINGKHKDALALLTTVEDVAAYDITAGYPV
ncbi:MAG: hypothetical protein V4463_05170 [Pseudomonadota bacterium]